ncbi:MAG: xanthine dehydrogenase family protein molybdopterin-binding subunit [Calditrichaeota bacterium]|nr:xanthine dehydrogenase family protein molybdopterin-binding subunit [Calditrichota bacterium]
MADSKIIKSKYFFEEDFTEELAEVSANKYADWNKKELKVVGKPVSRVDGYDKVSGSAVFTFDVILPNMAHAKTLRCPHPHAKIKRINTKKAEKIPGVLGILTYENAPKISWYGKSFLFDPHLRYEGDEVAFVAAENERIAEQALKLIEVDYEILPFVTDAAEAMKKDAPKLYDDGNIRGGKPSVYERGDIDKGFEEASAVAEQTYKTQVEIHNPTEPHCSVVNWDGDYLTIWDSTQGVFSVRDRVADVLKLPASRVRVIKKYMGGAFGAKLEAGKYTVMAALLARKIGRPVRIALDRREMNLSVGNRPDSVQKLKGGATKDGRLTALYQYSYGAAGAHPAGAGCSWALRTMYLCPNVKTEEYTVYINAGRARPFRAPGHVQGFFALEALIDELAEKIGMDPLEFRIKNHTDRDQVFDAPYTSKLLLDAYRVAAEAIGWKNRPQPAGSDAGPLKRGIGMSSQIWWGGGGPPAYATLKLNRDGSVRIIAGSQDIGTGTYTILAQVASEVLEIPMEKVEVLLGDTAVAPYCGSSGGSTTAPSVSPAVRDAAEQMKAKLLSGAAAHLNVSESQLVYRNGVIHTKGKNKKSMTIREIARKMGERVLVTTGKREANPDGYAINSFGVQFAEVEVDTETGKVSVKKIVAAYDIGRVLNPKTLENQIHGGIIQGLGFALFEERIIDRNTGKVLTTNLHDYKLPTVKDTPQIDIRIVSKGDSKISNTGVKGVGEPAMIPTPAAIGNAVYNAIGKRIKSLPITPDKVLTALQS